MKFRRAGRRRDLRQGISPQTAAFEPRVLLAAANPLDLSALDGTNGFRLDGIDVNDLSGFRMSGAGDVNGDGFDDVIIGAYLGDPGGDSYAGECYVVFGKSAGFAAAVDLSTLDGTNGFRLDGIDQGDETGRSVSGAGDINGDGFDDLIVGARDADPGGNGQAGESYVVFGKANGWSPSLDLSTLNGTNGFRIDGIDPIDYAGMSVSSAGDINGDGFDDLIIGAVLADPGGDTDAGETYVVFGKAAGFDASLNLSTLNGTNGFRIDGIDPEDRSGRLVSTAGDVNGDGFDDVIIGAHRADPGADDLAGESYVVFGKSGAFSAALDLSALDGSNGFRIDGVAAGDHSGYSVSGAGDVNGDGFADVIIGAYGADAGGDSNSGSSYVVFGRAGLFAAAVDLSTLDGTNGFRLDGVDAGDASGISVSGAGDVNGDGFDDVIIGAYLGDPGGEVNAGVSYVVFGKADAFAAALDLSTLNGTNGFRVEGISAGDRSGVIVSRAGDVNGDGFDDLMIGAYKADAGGDADAGASYVVFGGNFTGGPETQVGSAGANTLTSISGSGVSDVLVGGQGDDVLISDGGADVLLGGQGNDTLILVSTAFRRVAGGSGTDTLNLSGGGQTLDLTTIADSRIVDLEVIDITGTGNNALTLNFREVVNLSSHSNSVRVRRDPGDIVNKGSGWVQGPDEVFQAATYEVFSQGTASLKIQRVVPVIVAPPAVTTVQRPIVSWSAVPGAVNYQVWVTNVSSNTRVDLASVAGTTYTPSVDLGIGRFRVWVRAAGTGGVFQEWSAARDFRIVTAPILQPLPPQQNTHRPVVSWNGLLGAVSYDIWINRKQGGVWSTYLNNQSTTVTSFRPGTDLPLGQFRIWVRGIAVDGTAGGWSLPVEFQVMAAPVVTQGLNSTFDRTPTFAWNASPGAITYEVFLRDLKTNLTSLYERGIGTLSFAPVSNLADGPYRVWVRAIGSDGVGSFWTTPADINIGGRAVLLSPTGNTGTNTPTFRWKPVDGAIRYDLWVDQIGVHNQIIRETFLIQNQFTPSTPLPTGSYRAWVRAVSSLGEVGAWSEVLTFTITGTASPSDNLLADGFRLTLLLKNDVSAPATPPDSLSQAHSAPPDHGNPLPNSVRGESDQKLELQQPEQSRLSEKVSVDMLSVNLTDDARHVDRLWIWLAQDLLLI